MQKIIIGIIIVLIFGMIIGCSEEYDNPLATESVNFQGSNKEVVFDHIDSSVKIITLGESEYVKKIIKGTDPSLIDENFEGYDGGSQDSIFYSIRDRFSSWLYINMN